MEVPSVNMTKSIHQWMAGKTNCDVFDVTCETDRDCNAACETLYSEDGGEITKFICDKERGRCNRKVHNSDSLKKAAEDLSRIKKRMSRDETFKAALPDTFVWFINHNGGNLFVNKRAAYYDIIGLAIGNLKDSQDLIKIMERRTAESLRERLHRNLDVNVMNMTAEEYAKARKWIKDITREAAEEEGEESEGIPFRKLVKQITGGYHSAAEDFNTDDEDEDLEILVSGFVREKKPAIDVVLKPVSKSKMRDDVISQRMTKTERMRNAEEYLCNEEMHAGRAEAVYREIMTGEHIAYCVCQYPEYLVGPTCRQRTYKYVIDYEKWAETGHPEFLVDPIKHFEKAENVCKSLGTNSRAVYDSFNHAFQCAPIAELVKTALTFRGPHEPTLIIERDINKIENAPSKTFGVNWSYVNLLERIKRRL